MEGRQSGAPADNGWRRTFDGEKPCDFTFEPHGVTVGRIYRHHDGKRWQSFRWLPSTANAIHDSKEDAARVIDEGDVSGARWR